MLKTLHKKLWDRFGLTNVNDSRSRRLIVVIECILNQNARDAGVATFPAINWPIVQLCNEFNVGILQIPCPEINFLGFDRKRQKGQSIRDALDTREGRNFCRKISINVADRIEDYVAQDYQIISILGGNPKSPGCAVHYEDGNLSFASGVLMRELQDELRKRGIEIPFKGIRDYDPKMFAQDIEWVCRTFSKST
jgi:predicted secreted protein